MRNPSHPFSLDGDTSRDATLCELVVALTALPLRWTDKGARVIAHSLATALDAALHPALVYVALHDPVSGEMVTVLDGKETADADVAADQWRALISAWLKSEADERVHVIAHPARPGKLKLTVVPIGLDRTGGYIALASADSAFPRERDELLQQVAAHQAAVGLENLRLARAKPQPPAAALDTGGSAPPRDPFAAQAQQARLQLVSDAIPALIAYVDRDHVYRFANHCYQDWFGQSPGELIGRHVREVLGEEAYSKIRPWMERALAGERVTYEARLSYKTGRERHVFSSYVPDRDADGAIRGYFSLVQDISAHALAEQALKESEERFRRLADMAPVLIWMTDEHKRSEYLNKRWQEFTGQSPAQAIDEDWSQYLHPDDRERCVQQCLAAFEARVPFTMDFRMRRHDGAYRWMNDAAIPRVDADGKFRGFIGAMVDITERKQLEEAHARMLSAERDARAEAELLRDLGTALNTELDIHGLLQRVTDAATAAVGAEFGAFFYNSVNERGESYTLYTLSGASRDAFAKFPLPRNTALFGPTFRGETIVRSDDIKQDPRYGQSGPYHGMPAGHLPVTSYLAVPVRSRSGQVLGGLFFGHAQPGRFVERHERIVAGIAAQSAVAIDNVQLIDRAREHAERLRVTHEQAPMGIAEAGLDGGFLSVNDRFCSITGYSREELLRLRLYDITHPEDRQASGDRFDALLAGRLNEYQYDKRYVRKDGREVWVKVTVSLVRDGGGEPKYAIGAIEDITERRRADIVISGQKKALEQMARGEPLPAVLETLIETFDRQSTAGAAGLVMLLDIETRVLRPAATGRLPAAWIEAIRVVPVAADAASCGTAAHTGESVFVSDIATDPRWVSFRDQALALGFRAAWSLCLRSSTGRVLGTFGILYKEARAPSAEERRFVELLSDTAAVAVERYQHEKSLRLQAQVLSHIHDAVVMLDLEGRVIRWNEGAERMFGYNADEAIGKALSSLCLSRGEYSWLEKYVINPVKRDKRFERVAPLRRRSGELIHAHMSLSLLADDKGTPSAIVGYMLDVTERVRAEKELGARMRQQAAVARLGQTALSGVALPALFDEAVRLAAQTLDVELTKVLELSPDGRTLLLRAGVGWRDGLVGHGTVGTDRDSQAGYTLASPEPVVVADLRAETRFRGPALLHEHGVVSGMSVVIQGDAERAYGVLGAHSTSRRRFTANDVNFLQSVAHILATAIQRKRFEDAMHQAQEDLERRVDERTGELARANQSLRDEVVERMGVENALRDSESQYRMLFERNPLSAWVFDINSRNILAANETAVWQYGYTREEFLRMNINDLHPAEEAMRALDYTGQFPPETAYIGAWKHRKQDETVIDVEVFVYEVLFQGRWARLMLANDITERRRTEHEFRLMETITRAVSEARDVDAALYAVLRPICESTGWVLGEAWLPAADQQRMRASRAWYCGAENLEEFRQASWECEIEATEGLIGRAWTTRQPIWMADVTNDERFRRAAPARAAGLRAGIAFPVLAEGEVVAMLAFFLREPRAEDEHQVKLVSTIGAQVGIAIQRKRAEERLRESEERFRLLVEGAHDYAIYMLDPEGRIASWNRGAERLKGYAAEEIIGQHVRKLYTAEDSARRVPEQVLARAASAGAAESEGWRVRKSGERLWVSVTVTALRDSAGALRGFVKVTRDITERKRAEERLKESEARLARAQEFSLLMVAHTDLAGRWLKVPPMLCATLAYREEELLAGRVADVTPPDDFAEEWAHCERLVRGEAKSFDLEKRFLRRDGKVIWVYQNTSIVLDADDRPLHFLTFVRDITQRKEAEEQLRRSKIQLSEAQRLAHLGSWEWDIETGRMEWSEELYRIYGLPLRTAITYQTYLEQVHVDDRAHTQETIAAALATRQPFALEERIVRTDGETRHLLSHGAVVTDPRGEVTRLVGVCLDITERKLAEERLRDYAHRLQSLSQRLLEAQETERRRIARELHDQIGQDLSVIKINLQAMQRLPGAAAVSSHVDETIRVVEGVLSTARNLSVELRPSMLDDLGLAAALRWYLDRQAQRAGVRLHFTADTRETRMDPTIETACFRLAQEALTNILRHADARRVEVTLRQDDTALELRIVDDGRGFDVDFARERAARGESFGLLGMEERALLAGGELEIISAPGQGATVISRFPFSPNAGSKK